ncbi:MAG TPA: DUF3108 domain-containing protein [Burkholderiales bacterium]|nr:DUF3108 domain-containing protein [Burkholderiales bacterium]
MNPTLRTTALLLGSAVWVAAASAQPPQAISASYNVYMNGTHVAVMNEAFEARDRTYRIVSESIPIGVLALFQKAATVESNGQLTADGLRPELFEGRRVGSGQIKAEFDWMSERLSLSHDGKTDTVALPSGTQDRLSIMYQFMFYTYDRREHLDLAMTDGRRYLQHRYLVTPDVEIDTPLGRVPTLHLVKQTEPDGSGTEIWLARQYHFLPVKMVIRESNGTRYEQVATRIEAKGP